MNWHPFPTCAPHPKEARQYWASSSKDCFSRSLLDQLQALDSDIAKVEELQKTVLTRSTSYKEERHNAFTPSVPRNKNVKDDVSESLPTTHQSSRGLCTLGCGAEMQLKSMRTHQVTNRWANLSELFLDFILFFESFLEFHFFSFRSISSGRGMPL
jgi:hypothetical protein